MKRVVHGAARAACLAIVAVGSLASSARAVDVTFPSGSPNQHSYMNVFDLPGNGGAYQFAGPEWGLNNLYANYSGGVITLGAGSVDKADTSAYWYQGAGTNPGGPGVPGNKLMDANFYIQDDTLAGQSVTFSMQVLSNTLASGYSSVAFIKEFAPDYSSSTQVTVPLTTGVFSITKATAPGSHIQYGFETQGANVWPDDVATKGFVTIVAVPEPASFAALAAVGGVAIRRRKR